MKKRLVSSAIGIAAFALLIVSCEKPDAELVGPLWRLESVTPEGASAIKPDPSRTYTLQFFDDSTFVGVADCDDLFGQYWILNRYIHKISLSGVTRRGCDEATPSVDEYYPMGILNSSIMVYEISGNMLALDLDIPYQVGDDSILNFETSD